MSEMDKSIALLVETYKSAVYAKNVQTFMHLYDPNVRVFDAWGVWSYEGSAAWQTAIEGWFTSLGTERVNVTFEELQSSAAREFAIVSAIVTYAAISAQGEQLRTMQNRLSWGLRTIGHVPRIIHEHTSVPMAFEDAKAILQRVRSP